MAPVSGSAADPVYGIDAGRTYESQGSAMSWGAILGGAVAAAALTVVLLAVMAGLGLAALSPWPNAGASPVGFTIGAGIGLIAIQWLSAGLGGYVTGRLRAKWVAVHTHEVFFRDSAHGFLSWATASVFGALLLGSIAASAVGTGTRAAATVASGAAQGGGAAAANVLQSEQYQLDALFRGTKAEMSASGAEARGEAGRILANGLPLAEIPAADRTYLAGMIAARTGIPAAEAQKRIDDVVAQAKAADAKARELAEAARKSASAAALFTALAMLIAAFVASVAAALGGSQRDTADLHETRRHQVATAT